MVAPALPPLPPPLVKPPVRPVSGSPAWIVDGCRCVRAWRLRPMGLLFGLGLWFSSGSGCVAHEEVLGEPAGCGSGGATGGRCASGGGEFGAFLSGGSMAYSGGVGGTVSSGGVGGGSAGSAIPAGGGAADEVCSGDLDCDEGAWCVGGRCAPCVEEPCREGWVSVPRNGCGWCVPPSECAEDADCTDGGLCSPGQACLPGCDPEEPGCCHGNLCDVTGCGTVGLDCAVVGCPDGRRCVGGGAAEECGCDVERGAWLCGAGAGTCE